MLEDRGWGYGSAYLSLESLLLIVRMFSSSEYFSRFGFESFIEVFQQHRVVLDFIFVFDSESDSFSLFISLGGSV